MCEAAEGLTSGTLLEADAPPSVTLEDLVSYARVISRQAEVRRTAPGFIGYGSTKPGDRVLIAVDTHYDKRVVEAIATGLREMGAKVDVLWAQTEPDREFTDTDEIDVIMRREPWANKPRRWEGLPWVEKLALDEKYDLLVHGKGGGIPNVPHRYEAIPWLQTDHFASAATVYPRDLHTLINMKTWEKFFKDGRGGRVHLTDPEGTDLRYTLFEEYFDGTRRGYTEVPWWGHLLAHGPTPILPKEDATGTVAGTTSHFQKPFPRIKIELENGRVERVHGGARYGDEWRALIEESKNTQYPCFPRPGLFWLWEVAIGTNPKIRRPRNIHLLSSGGFEWERRRSGIVHVGLGTRWRGSEEVWAGERGILYGHLHVHLFFPTMIIEPPRGKPITVIDKGHLTALDDPAVRDLAAKYGDPDRILGAEWQPGVPGIDAPGSYEDYAREPSRYIFTR